MVLGEQSNDCVPWRDRRFGAKGEVARYLITGGAGFIGSHLVDRLVARGDRVSVLDDLSTGNARNLAQHANQSAVRLHRGSVLDPAVVRSLVADSDVVVHLAAAVGVRLILQRPLQALMTNIRGTEVVLEVCADLGRKTLVASTSEIYGKQTVGPIREDSDRVLGSPLNARWSYSTAKAVDEILAYTYWIERRLPTVIVRLFNCVGPRQTGAYGMVVPRLVRQALLEEDLTVYGDGEQQRCFCHVYDTVDGLLRLIDHPGAVGDVFNLGSQQEVSINELARLILEMTESRSRSVHIPYERAYERGFEDMQRRVPDISKLRALTGWKPARSLAETLRDVIEQEKLDLDGALAAE